MAWFDKLLFKSTISHHVKLKILGFISQDCELSATHQNKFATVKL